MAVTSGARILCVADGGATGTRVRLHDGSGALLASSRAGPSSLTLGVDGAWRSLLAAIEEAAGAAGLGAPGGPGWRVAAALAGSRSAQRRTAFLAGNPLACEIVLMSDGYAALLGALGRASGSVVVVGTGIAARRLHPDGRVTAICGWGFPVADEGSGAWIGHRAAQAFLRHRDGRSRTPSALHAEVEARLGTDREAVLEWLLSATATDYAGLAPSVVAAAARGDALAGGILADAASEVASVIGALDGDAAAEVVALLGGLAPVVAGRLPTCVQARLVPARGGALDGALDVLTGRAPEEAA